MKIPFPHLNTQTIPHDTGLIAELQDLSRETLRDIAAAVFVAYLLWIFIGAMTWPVQLGPKIWISALLVVPLLGLALWMIPRHMDLARAILQASLIIGIWVNLFIFRRPEIGLLLALLPLISISIAGWKSGLATMLFVGLFAFLPFPTYLSTDEAGLPFVLVVGGVISGLIGYATRRTLLTVTERSLSSYAEARKNMLEAREHRGKLVKVLKDLDLAYYRLERANSALMSASQAAEEAERLKSELATTISHELRTPLNLIIGFVEVMMTSPESYGSVELPAAYRSDLNAIYRSALHVLALVDDVIDMSRLDTGHLGMTRSRLQLSEVIHEAVDMVRDYINTKGLSIDLQLEDALPALWMDRLRVRQVLLNLLVNATRFTTRGGITVVAERSMDMVRITITDTGQGISALDLPRVFDEFQSTTPSGSSWHSGSGLGLPISKKIIEAHGGRMGVESVYGAGSTFWFTLPVPTDREVEAEDSTLATPAPLRPAFISRPASLADPLAPVLVTTYPDAWTLALLKRGMSDFQVYQAANFDEAAQLAEQQEAIAILTDLPFEAAHYAPEQGKRLLVRYHMPSTHHAAEAMGAQELLIKPVTAQLLRETIHSLGLQPKSAMIIDDDPNITRLFRRILRLSIPNDHLYEVNLGEEALERMRRHRPELVLLDLDMPRVDGFTILKQKNADEELKEIPVIVITGHEDEILQHTPGEEEANSERLSLSVFRPGGFPPGEAVQAIDALIKRLSPQVDWAGSSGSAPGSKPAVKRAWEDTPPPLDSRPGSATEAPNKRSPGFRG